MYYVYYTFRRYIHIYYLCKDVNISFIYEKKDFSLVFILFQISDACII